MNVRLSTAITVALTLALPVVADDTTPALAIRDNTPHVVAFTNATIVVSPSKTLEKATLVVRDGRVEAVGTAVKVPADAVAIDATGRTLYPGFVDPYTDYGLASVGDLNPPHSGTAEKTEGTRSGANSCRGRLSRT